MIFDGHVHVGYYSRKGYREPFYYSPRRVIGVLNRCGVEEFIISSTCAQVEGIGICDILREAREVRRIAGKRAHQFFWLSGHLYEEDPEMHWMDSGLYEGIKFHEGETRWMTERQTELRHVLDVVRKRRWRVLFHSSDMPGARPYHLVTLAKDYGNVDFIFAHCNPIDEMAEIVRKYANVWTDTAYMSINDFAKLNNYEWQGRLLFGTDLPVWQAREKCGLTERYRQYLSAWRRVGIESHSIFHRDRG